MAPTENFVPPNRRNRREEARRNGTIKEWDAERVFYRGPFQPIDLGINKYKRSQTDKKLVASYKANAWASRPERV